MTLESPLPPFDHPLGVGDLFLNGPAGLVGDELDLVASASAEFLVRRGFGRAAYRMLSRLGRSFGASHCALAPTAPRRLPVYLWRAAQAPHWDVGLAGLGDPRLTRWRRVLRQGLSIAACRPGLARHEAEALAHWPGRFVIAAPVCAGAEVWGALVLLFEHAAPQWHPAHEKAVTALASVAGAALAAERDVLRLRTDNRSGLDRLARSLDATILALVAALEMRDPYTAGHQRRVARLAEAIARRMGIDDETVRGIRTAALIHDIGKIHVPSEILTRPGRLSAAEFEIIKTHPEVGYEILRPIEFPWPVADMVRQHHEKLDGSGYPHGLRGAEIGLGARIIAVADVVEAMASHRPYRPGLGVEAALAEISLNKNTLYDTAAADRCLQLFSHAQFSL